MLKGSDTIFRVYLRPLPMVDTTILRWSTFVHILFVQVFRFFDESDVIFRFHNEAAHDLETHNFIEQLLEAPMGRLGSVKTFWYSALNMLILDILNNPQTERVGAFGHLKMGMVRTCYSYEIIVNLLFMTVLIANTQQDRSMVGLLT